MASSRGSVSTFGLSEVYTPACTPEVDVVFVHGLNGDPYDTWTTHATSSSNSNVSVFWPQVLLPKYLPTCRILTYGYDANVSSFTDPKGVSKSRIHNHAEDFTARLAANRAAFPERPLVFVCHSLGGLVTKQCLIYSRSISNTRLEHLRSVYVSTYGIVFLGTPHNGSDLAKWGSLLQYIASATLPKKFFDSSSHLVDALKTNNETLQNINVQFNEIIPRLHLYLFYEAKPMDLKGTRAFVVDMESAAPLFQGAERMAIEKDHSTMCKFEDERSAGFLDVVKALERYTNGAPELIAFRWREEKSVRLFQQENVVREMLIERAASSRGTSPDTRLSTNKNTPHLRDSHQNDTQGLARLPLDGQDVLRLQGDQSNTTTTYEVEELEIPVPGPNTNLPHHTASNESCVNPSVRPKTKPNSDSIPSIIAPPGFRPNSRFFGFDIEMARLQHKLLDEQPSDIGVRSVLLYGSPGCGKSHLARQFVWQNAQRFSSGIFWIDCKTPQSLTKCFWSIAQALDCIPPADQTRNAHADDFIDNVRELLRIRDRWLIVFDGISFERDSDLTAFTRYIPDSKGSNIIYTTNDGTLENRNRLLEPVGIKIYPLKKEAACDLLYANMNLRAPPSSTQRSKARQLVKYYDYLPLGIHAAAHMLLARGRPLEKYVPGLGSGSADDRLATTYLDLLAAISRNERPEAANLLMLMCFFNHEVPLAFLQFGHSSLAQFQIDIKSIAGSSFGSGKRELDNSILILRKYGLIERHLQAPNVFNSAGRSSPETMQKESIIPQNKVEAINNDDKSNTESINSSKQTGVEVLRIHTVVQKVYLRNLQNATETSEALSWWLVVATRFLIAAWNFAQIRLSRSAASATADLREFETHAEKLWSHYPKSSAANKQVRQARHDLHEIRRSLKASIEASRQSSDMSEGRAVFTSIFEKSGSSSDEAGPRTPSSASDLTRASTWSVEADQVESPSIVQQQDFEPHYKETLRSVPDDYGYLSDNEAASMQRSGSNSTVTDDHRHRQTSLQTMFRGRQENSVPQRAPAMTGQVTYIEAPHMQRPMSAGSLAEAALVAMQQQQNRTRTAVSPERRPLADLPTNSSLSAQLHKVATTTSPHTSPRLIQAVLSNNAARRDLRDLPIEENITISRIGRPVPGAPRFWDPFLPGGESGSSHSMPTSELRGGFGLSRDRSRESDVSVQTEPLNFTDEEALETLKQPAESRPIMPKSRTASDGVRPPQLQPSSEATRTVASADAGLGISNTADKGVD